jgi:hypothetical protein
LRSPTAGASWTLGSRLEPLVDDHLIDRLQGGAALRLNGPIEREIVCTADRPWEDNVPALGRGVHPARPAARALDLPAHVPVLRPARHAGR